VFPAHAMKRRRYPVRLLSGWTAATATN
jgi:hypothetical protein